MSVIQAMLPVKTYISSPEEIEAMVAKADPSEMCVCHACGKIHLMEGRKRYQSFCICCWGAVK